MVPARMSHWMQKLSLNRRQDAGQSPLRSPRHSPASVDSTDMVVWPSPTTDGLAAHLATQPSASPLASPVSCQSAVAMAKQKSPFAKTLSDAHILQHGVPLGHLSREIPLVVLAEHRRLLCQNAHHALALSYTVAEQQRHSDLTQMVHTYFDCLSEWMRAFLSGEETDYERQHTIASSRGRAKPIGETLKLWCVALADKINEIREYERWRKVVEHESLASSLPADLLSTARKVSQIFEHYRWQPALIEPDALSRLEMLLAPRAALPAASRTNSDSAVIGLGLVFDPPHGDRPPSYPMG